MKDKKILVVEDDRMLSTVFKMFLTDLGYQLVGFFADADEALEKFRELDPDCVLMDIHLPGKTDGIKAAEIIYQKYNVPVIYLTSDTKESTIQRAVATNSYGYLLKPVNKTVLGISIEMALAKHKYDKEIFVRESRYRTLIEDSPDTIVVLTDDKIQYINFAGLKLFETIYIEELLEKNIYDFVEPENQSLFREKIEYALKNKTKTGSFSFHLNTLKNKQLFIEGIGSQIEFKNKNSVQIIFRKLSDSESFDDKPLYNEELMKNLNESEGAFQSVINSNQDAMFVIDKAFNIKITNRAARKFVSSILKKEISLDRSIFDLLNFLDKEEFSGLFVNSLEGVSHFLNRVFRFQDEKLFFRMQIFPLVKKAEEKLEYVCIRMHDFSERKKMENEINEIKSDLMPLFNSSIQRFYLVDFNYRIVTFNKASEEIIKEEFNHKLSKGDNLLDFIPKERRHDPGYFIEKFQRARNGEHVIYRQKINVEDSEQWVEAHLEPVSNEKGEINRILMWTVDVTKEKLSENALLESQKRYYSLFSEANDAILMVDHDAGDVLVDCNSKSNEMFGYTRDEMLGMDLLVLSPESQPSGVLSREKREKKIQEAYEGNCKPFYWVYKRKDGSLFDSEVSLTAIKIDENQKFVYAIIRDISERKALENNLRKSEQKIQSLFEAIPDAIFTVNKSGEYTDFKPDVNNFLGLDNRIVGKTLADLFPSDKVLEMKEKINLVLETGKPESAIYEIPTRKGKKWFESRIAKLNDSEVISVVREVTSFDKPE
ncbi:MAG: PAS domain S-box protein [Bacteroidales bacterium]|nr:PAS domain S-box protein [Bacteroidales bacterium]